MLVLSAIREFSIPPHSSFFQRLNISQTCLTFESQPTAIYYFIKFLSGWGQGFGADILLHSFLLLLYTLKKKRKKKKPTTKKTTKPNQVPKTQNNCDSCQFPYFDGEIKGKEEGCMDCPGHCWYQRIKCNFLAMPCDSDHKDNFKLQEQHSFISLLGFQ